MTRAKLLSDFEITHTLPKEITAVLSPQLARNMEQTLLLKRETNCSPGDVVIFSEDVVVMTGSFSVFSHHDRRLLFNQEQVTIYWENRIRHASWTSHANSENGKTSHHNEGMSIVGVEEAVAVDGERGMLAILFLGIDRQQEALQIDYFMKIFVFNR